MGSNNSKKPTIIIETDKFYKNFRPITKKDVYDYQSIHSKYIENIIKVFSLANIENIKLNYFIYSYFYLFFVKEINHNYNYSDSDEYDYYLDNFPSEEYLDYIDLNIID